MLKVPLLSLIVLLAPVAGLLAAAPQPAEPPPLRLFGDYSSAVLADAPYAYYRLADTPDAPCVPDPDPCPPEAGQASDASSHGRHGTIYESSTPPTVAGSFPGGGTAALKLDGVDDYIGLPAGFDDFGAGLTIEAWIYPTSTAFWSRIVDLNNGPGDDNILFARHESTTDLTFEVYRNYESGGRVTAPNVLQLDRWQHVAVRFDVSAPGDYGTATIYYNGLRVTTGNTIKPANVTRTQGYLGRSPWGDEFYAGRLAGVAIFDTLLPEEDLVGHYNASTCHTPQASGTSYSEGGCPIGSAVSSAYQGQVTGQTPLAYWRLNEPTATGVAWDLTGHGHNAVGIGGVTRGVSGALTGESGTATQFDGIDGHLQVAPGLADFSGGLTVEAWVYPTASGFWERVIDFGNGGGFDSILLARRETSNDLVFEVYNEGGSVGKVTAEDVLISDTWQQVAATLAPDRTVRLYHNGDMVASGTIGAMPRVVERRWNYIGRSNWGGDAYFTGKIDEVAIYPAPLSPSDLRAFFVQGNPPDVCDGAPLSPADSATLTIPAGGTASCTFTGTAGQRVSLLLNGVTLTGGPVGAVAPQKGVRVRWSQPNGTAFYVPVDVGTWGGILTPDALPVSGTYTITFTPTASGIHGDITLTLGEITASIPPSTESWYVKSTTPSDLYDLGYNTGVKLRGTLPEGGVVALLFGKPYRLNGVMGTRLTEVQTYVALSDIKLLAKEFMRGYAVATAGHANSSVEIALSTSNYRDLETATEIDGTCGSITCWEQHGVEWQGAVYELRLWAMDPAQGLGSRISSVHGASDIELDWNDPDTTKLWVDGYMRDVLTTGRNLYVLGTAGGCDPRSSIDLCANPADSKPSETIEWQRDEIVYMNWGATTAYPLPQLYGRSGIEALQWQQIKLRSLSSGPSPIEFIGVTGPNQPNITPTEAGWLQLKSALASLIGLDQDLNWLTYVSNP